MHGGGCVLVEWPAVKSIADRGMGIGITKRVRKPRPKNKRLIENKRKEEAYPGGMYIWRVEVRQWMSIMTSTGFEGGWMAIIQRSGDGGTRLTLQPPPRAPRVALVPPGPALPRPRIHRLASPAGSRRTNSKRRRDEDLVAGCCPLTGC